VAASALFALSVSLLPLAAAAPATAAGTAHAVHPAWDNTAPLTVTPSSGGAGISVTVRATCQPSDSARSDAFQQPITLRQGSDGVWTGTGTIRETGLQIGRSYSVTVRCASGGTLSNTFTFTAATPSGGASAGFGGGSAESNNTQATALAIGGGVAIAGTAAYLFLARRRRSVGQHYY
jgi:hypothetical protein